MKNSTRGSILPIFPERLIRLFLTGRSALLNSGKSVILDGSFKKQADRQAALALAQESQADFLLIECQCSEEEIQKRWPGGPARRTNLPMGGGRSSADQKKDYEKVEGFPSDLYLSLNTERPPEECLGQILQHLLERAGRELSSAILNHPSEGGPSHFA